jgi:hypothetical protein
MNEQAKIKEAHYFLDQILAEPDERENFIYSLSAFVSAARSPLQYACKEAAGKTGGQAWYDRQVTGNAAVKFFKDARDLNIHERPVAPQQALGLNIGATARASASVTIAVIRANGTMERFHHPTRNPEGSDQSEVTITRKYFFEDWLGKEDVVALCTTYLAEVERIVADGVANGILTP